jgi:hypothetical protein
VSAGGLPPIEKVSCPVFPPDEHAAEMLAWLVTAVER